MGFLPVKLPYLQGLRQCSQPSERRRHWRDFLEEGNEALRPEWSSWGANPALPDPRAVVFTLFSSFKRIQGCLPSNQHIIQFHSCHRLHIPNRPLPPKLAFPGTWEWELEFEFRVPVHCLLGLTAEWGAGSNRDEPGQFSPLLWSTKSRWALPLQPKCHLLRGAFPGFPSKQTLSDIPSLCSVVICDVVLFTGWYVSCFSIFF